ncbi:MAG: cyclic nucleotide-binding domain-containing protein [Acidobacteria bacterium]|nr:cyclic nucleotide-binding domain-containing protein [Acidobacteriota bacterium]
MDMGGLGKVYRDGEIVVRQGEMGDCMFVIQAGQLEVLREEGARELRLTVLGKGDIFGEMALFDGGVRSATVRALGEARALTLDKRTFLRRVHEDPSLAFRILQTMSHRIRQLNGELVRLKSEQTEMAAPRG